MMSGINGYAKGFLAGGAVGAFTGLLVGAVIAIVAGPAAIVGGLMAGMSLFATVGGFSGMATEIVRGREAHQVSGADVTNVAKVALAQGVSVGHQQTMAQAAEAHKDANFRKMVEDRRIAEETTKQR